ncbi:MAG TPA: hypothetical protein VHN37_09140, partial [Actinomycetota bacterium]|nr:hypothetical protein [Actinomycetota bacterium]
AHEIAIPYARDVLRTGATLTELIRFLFDLSKGRFEATVDFRILSDDRWEVTPLGYDQNRIEREYPDGGRVFDPAQAVVDAFLPLLQDEGRILIVEGFTARKPRDKPPDPADPQRLLLHPRDGGFEEYLVVPGPLPDGEVLHSAVRWALPHRGIGAVVQADVSAVPMDMSLLSEEGLSAILEDVLALFMRQTSFDAYLLWWRE